MSILVSWFGGSKDAPQLSVGWGGDIPILPPFLALGLAAVSLLIDRLVKVPLLPKNSAFRSFNFRLVIALAGMVATYYVISIGGQELESVGSGVAFTPVGGLATTGVYALTRNPLYFGIVFISVPAIAVAADSAWPMFITATLLYTYLNAVVIPAEEDLLRKEFGGQYDAYCEEVPRWF